MPKLLESLDNALGVDTASMLGKEEPPVDGDPFKDSESEQRAWDEHKDECNGCALCEL